MTEFTDEEKKHIEDEAVKYQELAKFIANQIFQTTDIKVGYQVIAKFASEDYFIIKGDELKNAKN